ncbi:MAG: peptide-binding protein [bacterium]
MLKRSWLVVIVAIALSAIAWGSAEVETAKEVVVLGTFGETVAPTLNPFITDDSASWMIADLIFDSALMYNERYEVVPYVVESWEFSEDGLQITERVRKGIKFTDGRPLTAHDIAFTFNSVLKNPKVNVPFRSNYDRIIKCEVLDDYTLRYTAKERFATFLISTSFWILPKHILEKETDINTSAFNRNPIGSGRYKLVDWRAAEQMVLTKNKDHFMGEPVIDTLVYRVVPDQSVEVAQLKTGELDYIDSTPFKDVDDLAKNPNITVTNWHLLYYEYLGFNHLNPLFRDKRVRQAIAYALDRQSMVKTLLKGYGQVVNSPIPPISWAFDPYIGDMYPYDVKKAKKLLKEAGWEDTNKDGIIDKDIDGDGKRDPFKFKLVTNAGNTRREKVIVIIQQYLKELGMAVETQTLEWSVMVEDILNKLPRSKDTFDAIVLAWGLTPDPDDTQVYHTKSIEDGSNMYSYSNPRIDELLDRGITELDQEKRKEIYKEYGRFWAEELPVVPLYNRDEFTSYNSKLVIPLPIIDGLSSNAGQAKIEKWFWKE